MAQSLERLKEPGTLLQEKLGHVLRSSSEPELLHWVFPPVTEAAQQVIPLAHSDIMITPVPVKHYIDWLKSRLTVSPILLLSTNSITVLKKERK